MPNKKFMLDGEVPVNIYKRRGSRNLRLTINAEGEARVSIPAWAPYSAGLNFARSRKDWIIEQRRPASRLVEGQAIGKAHHLTFRPSASSAKPSSRLSAGAVVVSHPVNLNTDDPAVQAAARAGSIRALRTQAERLLPQRLADMAEAHGFRYSDVRIKHLKSRWGSCDQDRRIVLNLFLMQLSWEHIDYVILHELMHTRIMKHGPDFWEAMAEILPDVKDLRKSLNQRRAALDGPGV